MNGGFSNARVLITGGAVRIGRAIALAFARAGARVVVHCFNSVRHAESLVAECSRFGAGHEWVQADLRDPNQRRRIIPELVDRGGPLQGLVNNASVYRRRLLHQTATQDWLADYEINALAPFELMQDFARHCGRGWIINILDHRVAAVDPGAGAYALAKKTLRDITEAAAVEWAPEIRVNGVAPGYVLPPPGVPPERMERLLRYVPLGRACPPEDVAAACLFLARTASITGEILFVDGGLHLVNPAMVERTRGAET